MGVRQYSYVGPEEIRLRAAASPPGHKIESRAELNRWAAANRHSTSPVGQIVATFIVALDGRLCLGHLHPRTHSACGEFHAGTFSRSIQ
jgi:hypothetical protein